MAKESSALGMSYYKSALADNAGQAGPVLYALDLVSDLPSPIKEEMFVAHLWSALGLGSDQTSMQCFENAA